MYLFTVADDSIDFYLEKLKTVHSFEETAVFWKKTFNYRTDLLKSDISTHEYITTFPALEQVDGYKLVQTVIFKLNKYVQLLINNFILQIAFIGC